MKPFKAPSSTYYQVLAKKRHAFVYDVGANLEFDLHFYFPKYPRNRVTRIVIMFNGLNEIYKEHLELYDTLGVSFAEAGIAAVLLPTPFHLNRAAVLRNSLETFSNRDAVPERRPHYKIPSDQLVKDPFYLSHGFIQTLQEYRILRSLLDGEFDTDLSSPNYIVDPPSKEDRAFYQEYIKTGEVEVSLLGNSLGGLQALTCLSAELSPSKRDNKSVMMCALLNSGGSLRDMRMSPVLDNQRWYGVVEELLRAEIKQSPTLIGNESPTLIGNEVINHPDYPLVQKILFEEQHLFSEDALEQISKILVLIIGGKDHLVPHDTFKRLESKTTGLNVLQLSELGHFIAGDKTFQRWYPRLVGTLFDVLDVTWPKSLTNGTERGNTEYVIQLPAELKTLFRQYLLYFTDYVEKAKGKTVDFQINPTKRGLVIKIVKSEQAEIIEYLKEYVGFVKTGLDKIEPKIETRLSDSEMQILIVELRTQVRFFQSQLEIKAIENKMLNDTMVKFYNLLELERKNPPIMQARAEAKSSASASAQALLDLDLKIELPEMQKELRNLKNAIIVDEAHRKELEAIDNELLLVDENGITTESIDRVPFKKLKRILDEIVEPKSTLNKAVTATTKGINAAKKLAGVYNKFAQWLALPQVPDVFLK